MADKPKLKYRIVTGRKPGTTTGETIMRPQIVERETYYIDQVVSYALDAGYIRGQFEDSKGTVNGFIEACKVLGQSGKAVNLANWLRIHAELTGSVGEERQLTDANDLHVNITALTDLKVKASEFSWTNVDDTGVVPKIDTLMYVGGTKTGEIKRNVGIIATGKNLAFSTELGDAVALAWLEGSTPKTASLTPSESDYSHQTFAFPTALANTPAGTEIVFTFTLHGGVEGGAAHTIVKTVKLLEGVVLPDPVFSALTYAGGENGQFPNCGPWKIKGTHLDRFNAGDLITVSYTKTDGTAATKTFAITAVAADELTVEGFDSETPTEMPKVGSTITATASIGAGQSASATVVGA